MSPIGDYWGAPNDPAVIEAQRQRQKASGNLWSRGPGGPPPPPGRTDGALIYAQSAGAMVDDGSGTYTGSAGASINWPSAVWHHYADQFSILGSSDFTTASTTFGSFAEARTSLNAKVSGNWDVIVSIVERTTPSQLIDRMEGIAPIKIYRSMLDGKYKCVVYKQTPDTYDYFLDPFGSNYSWKYSEDMAESPKPVADLSPLDGVVNEVHVRYGEFAPDGSLTKDAYVSPDGSDDGSGTRDQNGALGAANDREARAVRSAYFYGGGVTNGFRQSVTVEAPEIYTDEVAVALRNYIFDRRWRRRVTLDFLTGPRAADFYQGMATLVDNELQDYVPCPYNPLDGGSAKRWGDLKFYGNARRRAGVSGRYLMRLVEIT